MRSRWGHVGVLLLTLVWGLSGLASAQSVTFTVQAVVDVVDPPLAGAFAPGDVVNLTYVFDAAAVDSNADPTIGSYRAITSASVSINSYAGTGATGDIRVVNPFDEYEATGPHTGPTVNGCSPSTWSLNLVDSTATAFASDALPLTLDLGDFDSLGLNVFFTGGPCGEAAGVLATPTRAVPAVNPAGLAVLALLLGGMGWLALRRAVSRP